MLGWWRVLGSHKVESTSAAAWLDQALPGEKHPESSNTTTRKKEETFYLQHNADSKVNIIKGS